MVQQEYYNPKDYEAQRAIQQPQLNAQIANIAPRLHGEMEERRTSLVEQINPIRIKEQIELALRGYERRIAYDGEKQGEYEEVVKITEQLLNDEGIGRIMVYTNALLHQSTTLSHLDKEQIRKIMLFFADDLIYSLQLNKYKWGIKTISDLDMIHDIVIFPIYTALNRALGQNEKNFLSKITVENLSSQPPIPKKEGGFWNKLRIG